MALPIIARAAARAIARMDLRKATKDELEDFTKKTKRNVLRRVDRLEKQGIRTDASHTAHLRREPLNFEGMTRQELQREANLWRTIDESPGTRAKTAPKVAKREARQRRIESLKDLTGSEISRMDRDTLSDAIKDLSRHVRPNVNRVRRETDVDLRAVDRMDKLDEKMQDNPNPTLQQMRHYLAEYRDISNMKSSTLSGAKEQMRQGVEIFGDDFTKWDSKQRNAVWEQIRRMAEARRVGSDVIVSEIKAALGKDKLTVKFVKGWVKDSDGKSESYEVVGAGIAMGESEAEYQAIQEQARRDNRERIVANSRTNPIFLGPGDEDDDDGSGFNIFSKM